MIVKQGSTSRQTRFVLWLQYHCTVTLPSLHLFVLPQRTRSKDLDIPYTGKTDHENKTFSKLCEFFVGLFIR